MTRITRRRESLIQKLYGPGRAYSHELGWHDVPGSVAGRPLADFNRHLVAASLITRHAVTHSRIQEDRCNGTPGGLQPQDRFLIAQEVWEARTEKRDAQIESLITRAAEKLDNVERVEFSGDPRGSTVKIITQDGREIWNLEGPGAPLIGRHVE